MSVGGILFVGLPIFDGRTMLKKPASKAKAKAAPKADSSGSRKRVNADSQNGESVPARKKKPKTAKKAKK